MMEEVDMEGAPELRADFVSSVAAGLRVLSAFSPQQPELGVGELSRNLGMDKRRAQRLVSTLYALGYLEQDPLTRKYRPGLSVLDLGFAALDSLGFVQVARPFMLDLSARFGHSVNLAAPSGVHMVVLDCLRGERSRIGVHVHVGERLPIHLTSLGKAVLANMTREHLEELLAAIDFRQPTPHAVGTANELREQLTIVRERGFAIMDQEATVGVRSVAAAVRCRSGDIVGAVNVATPSQLMSVEELVSQVGPAVAAAGDAISQRLVRPPEPLADTPDL